MLSPKEFLRVYAWGARPIFCIPPTDPLYEQVRGEVQRLVSRLPDDFRIGDEFPKADEDSPEERLRARQIAAYNLRQQLLLYELRRASPLPRRSRETFWLRVALLALLVAWGLTVWFYDNRLRQRQSPPPPPAPVYDLLPAPSRVFVPPAQALNLLSPAQGLFQEVNDNA